MTLQKAIVVAVLVATVLGPASVMAAQAGDEITLTRDMVKSGSKQLIAENLGLTEEQGKVFWPLYEDYAYERGGLGERMGSLLTRYAAAYQIMDDQTATTLMDEYIEIQKDELALRKKWIGKMRKVLPGALVARFFQLDNKIDAYLKAAGADQIPLMSGGKPITIVPEG